MMKRAPYYVLFIIIILFQVTTPSKCSVETIARAPAFSHSFSILIISLGRCIGHTDQISYIDILSKYLN